MKIVDGVEATIEEGVYLEPGRYIVLATPNSYLGELPYSTLMFNLQGNLDNCGESLLLINSEGMEVDHVEYSDLIPWPQGADGLGASLKWIGYGTNNDSPTSWMPSNSFGENP